MGLNKVKNNNKLLWIVEYWLPVFLWAIIIFLFSSHPTPKTSEIHWKDFFVKKSAHIFEYAVLCTLTYRGLKASKLDIFKSGFFAIIFSIFYGFTDEFHQTLTPGREPKIRDVFFDTIGALLAILIIWRLLPKAPKKLKDLAKKLHIT